jgi:hypothetical protein
MQCFVSEITSGFSEQYRLPTQHVPLAKLARQWWCAALSEQGITNGKRLGKVFETVAAAVDQFAC